MSVVRILCARQRDELSGEVFPNIGYKSLAKRISRKGAYYKFARAMKSSARAEHCFVSFQVYRSYGIYSSVRSNVARV